MEEIDGGKRGESANQGGEPDKPEIMFANDAIIHFEHD
jgi:hypothetical protein